MTHTLPAVNLYELKIRRSCRTAVTFASTSSWVKSPQSPPACRRTRSTGWISLSSQNAMAALVMTICPSSKSATVMRLRLCLGQLDLHQLVQQVHGRGFTTFNQQRNSAHHQLALVSVCFGQVAQDAGRQ